MIVYVDGDFIAAAAATVPLDAALDDHLDGVFTTLRLYRGRPFLLTEHLQRLDSHGRQLGLRHTLDEQHVRTVLDRLAARNGFGKVDCRARLTVARRHRASPTEVPANTRTAETTEAEFSIAVAPLPVELSAWQRSGIGVLSVSPDISRGDRAHLKTLDLDPCRRALQLAARRGCQDALLYDQRQQVLEGAVSNVFLVRDGLISTPAGDQPLLAGLTRSEVIRLARAKGWRTAETSITGAELGNADEIFLTNAVREIVPVVQLDHRPVAEGTPGLVTRSLQRLYRRRVREVVSRHAPYS